MNAETFHIDYPNAVDTYINSVDTKIIQYRGREWMIFDGGNVFCMTKSARYCLPTQIAELMQLSNITKLHGGKLTLELQMVEWHNTPTVGNGMMGHYDDECGICGADLPGYYRYFTSGGIEMCEPCSLTVDGYTRSHITNVNFLDWIQFMQENYDICNYKYYVNCNPNSDQYGSVICDYCSDDYVSSPKIICNASAIVSKIREWFCMTPSYSQLVTGYYDKQYIENDVLLELEPGYYMYICDTYLNTTYDNSEIHNNVTRQYILEHEHDLRGYSESDVCSYIKYIKKMRSNRLYYCTAAQRRFRNMTDDQIAEYAQAKVAEDANKKMFDPRMIEGIRENLYDFWLYKHQIYKSFGAFVRNC